MALVGKNAVNLDALLPRADLFEQVTNGTLDKNIRIADLEPGITYDLFRKPDFQRETANWSPQQIVDLIRTFCESDIIPAIILWANGTNIFVVDGAHRLSALIGWVQSDFGAGPRSLGMFGGRISDHQRTMHDQTLSLVKESVGLWPDYKKAHGTSSLKTLYVQWIEDRTPQQAAKAFVRINQGGTPIDALETRIIHAGKSALSVATRVIARGGLGHSYWNHFSDDSAKKAVPLLGTEIYNIFTEPNVEFPLKTVEIPLTAGVHGVSFLRLAFDIVAISNDLSIPDSTRKFKATDPAPLSDDSGVETQKFLKRVKKLLQFVLSNEAFSLGLHPALYCYTSNGAFNASALLNVISWVKSLKKNQRLDVFRAVRGEFETMLLEHPAIVKPAVNKLGTGTRNRSKALALLDRTIDLLAEKRSREEVWATLLSEYKHLADPESDPGDGEGAGRKFSTGAKNAASLADLKDVARCPICQGLLHPNGKVLDHKDKKADGGSSHSSNGRWVHPICNSNRDKDEGKSIFD